MAGTKQQLEVLMNWRDLREPACRTFLELARAWGLTEEERILLLGCSCNIELSKWRRGDVETMGLESITRVSLLLGIYSMLHTVFSDPAQADSWPKRAHVSGALLGTTALQRMLSAGLTGMRQVHEQLQSIVT